MRNEIKVLTQGKSSMKTKMYLTTMILFLVLCCLMVPVLASPSNIKPEPEVIWTEGKVTEIKDGDTFEVTIGDDVHTCRLLGIDTPEKFKGRKLNADVRRTGIRSIVHLEAGSQASEYATNYFSNRFTPEAWIHIEERDLYGRDLCIVASKDTEPSIQGSYNCHVLLDGYAVFYKDGKNLKKVYRDEFKKCEVKDSGLWETFPVLMEKLK